jgi:glycosyltransferase involved in cell wall biosynthesis
VALIHFDVIFLDVTSAKYYDRITLEKEALGGTEASVIRVAEGLGELGLKVAVVEARIKDYFAPIIGQFAYFFHSDDIEKLSCKHYIQIRKNTNPQLFPGAKQYIWLHDVAVKGFEDLWLEDISKYDIQLVGVSRWHRNNIKEVTGLDNVKYIYNPVPHQIYVEPETKIDYNPHVITWLASPHKGLPKALELFKKIHVQNPKMQLIVFNPGYMKLNSEVLSVQAGISVYGSMPCKQVWSVVQKSLCVFYPTEYQETFGLIAAEANALGTPIVTSPIAGLKETVSSDQQFSDDPVATVLDWAKNGRPRVFGKEEFKQPNVVFDWVRLLAKDLE